MPSKISCKCCSQLFDGHLLLTCSVCKERFYHNCVGVSSNEVRILSSNKGYDWTCAECRGIGRDLKDLRATIIQLQKDIRDLKEENSKLAENPRFEFEDVVSEVSERMKRKSNVILFNVNEPDQSKTATERMDNDKTIVADILQKIDPERPVTNFEHARLGVFSNSKVRPIKLILENEETARKVWMKSNNLKSHNTYKNVKLFPDKTKKQMEYYKMVRQELENRHAAGDRNCRIKYVNDVPKIVQLN
nr:unnamed protein product [Callosobruchus analis]